jgi:hypothetical protein
MDIRCNHKLHGRHEGDILEVSCDSKFCGKAPGVVVLHRFNLRTGAIQTLRFSEPPNTTPRTKGNTNGH